MGAANDQMTRFLLRPLWNAGGCECLLFTLERGYELCLWESGYELCLWEKGRMMRVEPCVDEADARRKALGWFDQTTTGVLAPSMPITTPVK
jgi:hypothetical protein